MHKTYNMKKKVFIEKLNANLQQIDFLYFLKTEDELRDYEKRKIKNLRNENRDLDAIYYRDLKIHEPQKYRLLKKNGFLTHYL